jgi:hypothetical protein
MKNISNTLASGGSAQTLYDPAGQPYKGYWLRNNSTTSLWVNENGTAVAGQPSIEIKPGELYETPPNLPIMIEPLSIIGATTSQAWAARVW